MQASSDTRRSGRHADRQSPVVTTWLALSLTPSTEVPVRVTVYAPGESYAWTGLRAVDEAPSPNVQRHVAALRVRLANVTVSPSTANANATTGALGVAVGAAVGSGVGGPVGDGVPVGVGPPVSVGVGTGVVRGASVARPSVPSPPPAASESPPVAAGSPGRLVVAAIARTPRVSPGGKLVGDQPRPVGDAV